MIIIPGESIAALDRIGPVLLGPRLAVPGVYNADTGAAAAWAPTPRFAV